MAGTADIWASEYQEPGQYQEDGDYNDHQRLSEVIEKKRSLVALSICLIQCNRDPKSQPILLEAASLAASSDHLWALRLQAFGSCGVSFVLCALFSPKWNIGQCDFFHFLSILL